ncbi:Protein farnesyltransferase subunit beta [Harpegnathos saltator]|uniref:Protein farnesyltransferase subunit beta n=1 Tax=Harpegnathos saltator TaxID=610380 RepID=E2C461_HARSA|nr:Protein farnesyltransferase subunit beta [Harpegnathos saltator]
MDLEFDDILDKKKIRSYEEILEQKQDKGFKTVTTIGQCLDCSKPWLCYWILHSLEILGERLGDEEYSKIAGFLAKCQSPEGSFGGGLGQYPHFKKRWRFFNFCEEI